MVRSRLCREYWQQWLAECRKAAVQEQAWAPMGCCRLCFRVCYWGLVECLAMPAAAKARKVHPQSMLAGLSCFAEQQTHGIHFRDAEHSCDTLHIHLYSGCRLADDAHKSAHHKALTRRGEEENQGISVGPGRQSCWCQRRRR